jgi:ring-1,2-phenylacetyl-CoA epoxidase subunit PaaE
MDTLQLKVRDILPEGKDAARIFLESADGYPVVYKAGQFLTFIFRRHGRELRRSYSISSTPGIDERISITVKRIPNGEISRWLLDHLRPGNLLIAAPPAGRFTVETNSQYQRQFFFIAAGSGIVPVYSLLKKILNEETQSRVILVYQNHDESHVIFYEELQQTAKKYPQRFVWINLLSKPMDRNHIPERLTNFLLEKLVLAHYDPGISPLFYLCGSPAFMRMAQFTLKLSGFTNEQIRKENFTVEYIPPPPLITDITPKQITIHRNKQTLHIYTAYPTNILQAALNNHIQLPYSCRAGRCSSCVAKCLKGTVKMSINEVLTDKDLEEGLVLTCVGYAETDVELKWE